MTLQTSALKISAGVNLGSSSVSHMPRSGREDPQRRQQKFQFPISKSHSHRLVLLLFFAASKVHPEIGLLVGHDELVMVLYYYYHVKTCINKINTNSCLFLSILFY